MIVKKFYTPTCVACKTYNPIFEKVSEKYSDISFFSIDATSSPEDAIKYGIKGVPVTIIEIDNEPVHRINGVPTQQELENVINSLLN